MDADQHVSAKIVVQMKEGEDPVTVRFNPDYQHERNKSWASATPALSLSMTMRREVADQFQVGEALDLTFSRNPDQPEKGPTPESNPA